MALFVEKKNNVSQKNICSAEDRFIFDEENSIYGVFDGHGGNTISEKLSICMSPELMSILSSIDVTDNEAIKLAVNECFQKIDSILIDKIKSTPMCGSTCALVFKLDSKLILVNLGDSNIILFKNGEKHTIMKQHLYSNPEEKVEIDTLVDKGGICIQNGWAPKILNENDVTMVRSDIIKLCNKNERIVPTRNFGHFHWKQSNYMSIVPYIEIIDIEDKDKYEAVIVTDGVLDVLVNYDEIYPIISSAENQSEALVKFAEDRWRKGWKYIMDGEIVGLNQHMGVDDITAIYCVF